MGKMAKQVAYNPDRTFLTRNECIEYRIRYLYQIMHGTPWTKNPPWHPGILDIDQELANLGYNRPHMRLEISKLILRLEDDKYLSKYSPKIRAYIVQECQDVIRERPRLIEAIEKLRKLLTVNKEEHAPRS